MAGIWAERDRLIHIVAADFDPKTAKIEDCMTTDPHFARHDETLYSRMDKFLGLRIRHLPIKEDAELKKLNAMVSWEYYDNWRWDPRRS